ncbi:MAG: sialidase family protein [Corynebacterium sp.]|nr:sialidase family protein [Corynebacterium sp.]
MNSSPQDCLILDLTQPSASVSLTEFRSATGCLLLQFQSNIDGPIFALQGNNGHITAEITGGRLNGTYAKGADTRYLDAEDTLVLDDAKLHTLAFNYDAQGLHIHVDGYEAFSCTPLGWLSELEATELKLNPAHVLEISRVQLYSEGLAATALPALAPSAQPFLEFAAAELSARDTKRCGALAQGSLRARFRARGQGQGGTIIAGGSGHQRCELVLEDGNVAFRVFEHDAMQPECIASVIASGHWDDGNWHDVVLTSGRGALILYVDGYQVALAPGAAFFADIAPLERVTVGMNLANSRLFGEAQTAAIYDSVLSDFQVKRLAGVQPLPTQALFDTGFHDSKSYRIPSLLRLKSGALLAGADQRVSIANDSPNDINFVLRRSFDDGKTWEDQQTLIEYPGDGALGASVIDSVLVQDQSSERVLMVIDHFPGGVGQPNAAVGTGFDEQGRVQLHNRSGDFFTLHADGSVTTIDGAPTAYTVAPNGDVLSEDTPAGNIYLAYGVDPQESLFTHRTSYVQVIHTDDDGATWSAPQDITAQVKQPWMRFFGTSPGNGIQLKYGEHKGRILIPVYYNHEEGITFSCAAMYTDDTGATWHLGASPNDGREFEGSTLDSRTLSDDRASLHESALVELPDGSVHVFMRNQHPSGKVAHAISWDGGASWGEVDFIEQLTEIFSQPNAISIDVNGEPAVVFANASQMLPFRGCGVLRLSYGDIHTWPHNRVFQPRHYVYQCLAQLENGDLGLLWERETQGLFFTRIPLSWLTDSRNTLA